MLRRPQSFHEPRGQKYHNACDNQRKAYFLMSKKYQSPASIKYQLRYKQNDRRTIVLIYTVARN